MHAWARAAAGQKPFWSALYPTAGFSVSKTEVHYSSTDFIVLYVKHKPPLLFTSWVMLRRNFLKRGLACFCGVGIPNNLTYAEVVGKTRRISSTSNYIKLKLGTTNRLVFLLFNSMLFFYKKKHMCFFTPHNFLLRCGTKSSYSRNGLFVNEGTRTSRVGKLSTFR